MYVWALTSGEYVVCCRNAVEVARAQASSPAVRHTSLDSEGRGGKVARDALGVGPAKLTTVASGEMDP